MVQGRQKFVFMGSWDRKFHVQTAAFYFRNGFRYQNLKFKLYNFAPRGVCSRAAMGCKMYF